MTKTILFKTMVTLMKSILFIILLPFNGVAQTKKDSSAADLKQAPAERNGQHDFDFEMGTRETHLKRLLHPLTGSTTWVEYDGTTVVQKVWNGSANLVELVADGPTGYFEGLNLRLYNPQSHR